MLPFAAWLIGSKVGRWFLITGLALGVVGFVLLRVYSAGKAKERMKQKEAATKALLERVKVDEEIRKMPVDDRLRELERWVRE